MTMQNDKLVEALEPCPFCGGEAERFTINEEGDNFGGDVICCKRCGASSHVEFGRKENLVSCWNRRATLSRSDDGAGENARQEMEQRFWSIVDPNGVPSDMWDALDRLASAYRSRAHPPAAVAGEGLRETLKELAKGVFVDAATQVHYSWIDGTNGSEPDFGEAASDYAESFADAYVDTVSEALSQPAADAAHPPADALREAVATIMARMEALEDEASDALATELAEHASGFMRGQKATAKSLRAHLHDLTRAALSEAPSAGEGSAKTADADGGEA